MKCPAIALVSAPGPSQHTSHDLTHEQWHRIRPLFTLFDAMPTLGHRHASTREAVNGVLWKIVNACAWLNVPRSYPAGPYCQDICMEWDQKGLLAAILHELHGDAAPRMLEEARRAGEMP
ncbi:transposase [Paraburkholderia sp. J12]|uniref:transposase n=1 Tax=Paraburkholderia sp. J12 TaxID=2805432 RepID=UPI0039F45D02